MTTVPAGLPGFIGAEVGAPATPTRPEWKIVQRFRSRADLEAWRGSQQHKLLLEEARTLLDHGNDNGLQVEEITQTPRDGVVTEVVTTYVRPGKDREYREWARRIHGAEAEFPGYCGGRLQPPASDAQRYWMTLVRFETPEQLDAWLTSDTRRELLLEHSALVQSWEHHRLPSSFAGWFPPEAGSGQSPPSWKQSLLVLLMLFPLVEVEVRFITPRLRGLNPAMVTFINNTISVSLLGFLLMPMIIAQMRWWLWPRNDRAGSINIAGVALLLALYAVEITLLSRLW